MSAVLGSYLMFAFCPLLCSGSLHVIMSAILADLNRRTLFRSASYDPMAIFVMSFEKKTLGPRSITPGSEGH